MDLSPFVTLFWCFAPIFFLLSVMFVWRWWIGRRKERSPTSEKLLRPAGESLRKRIEQLDDRVSETLCVIIMAPFGLAAALLSIRERRELALVIYVTIGTAIFIWLAVRLFRAVIERRNVYLGFHGERAVAEELNQLMLHGCRVFHDVPMEPYGNIDHVVVAPSGVFAVETKTRRKRPSTPGKRDYEVVYNGNTLEFPHYSDSHGIEQARQQADRLRAAHISATRWENQWQ